jgi:hypothetical protein
MINETALRDVLMALLEQQKSQMIFHSGVLRELAALRETVRGLDPTFADVIEHKREEAKTREGDIVARQVQLFDEMLQKVKSGYVC